MAPDTLGIRHIVLPYTQEALADSLLTVLKNGGDFAADGFAIFGLRCYGSQWR